eukprot:COSAG01_NODE_26007_length_714_cov_1.153110_1_plen_100_part_00
MGLVPARGLALLVACLFTGGSGGPCAALGSTPLDAVAQAHNPYYVRGAAAVQARARRATLRGDSRRQRAKNVLLFVADGNGVSSNYATRVWQGQQAGGL